MQYGQVIRLVAFDSFKEILQYPIDHAAESLEKIDTTSSDTGGYDLRKRSQLIKYILAETGLKDTNLLTTDANHFEDSWSTGSLGDKTLDVTKLDRYMGGVIGDVAVGDPVKTQGGTHIGESGYDYRVEPRLVSSAVASKPILKHYIIPRFTNKLHSKCPSIFFRSIYLKSTLLNSYDINTSSSCMSYNT